jgi:hypothetical protein
MMAKPLKLTFATAICLKENPGALHLSVGFTGKIMSQIPEVAFVRIYFNKKKTLSGHEIQITTSPLPEPTSSEFISPTKKELLTPVL